MSNIIDKVLVEGRGKVGSRVGTLLNRSGCEGHGGDARPVEGVTCTSEIHDLAIIQN